MPRVKYEVKRDWILDYMRKRPYQRITLAEGDMEEAYAEAFGVKLNMYTVGPSTCPDMARILRRMDDAGEVKRSTGGNQNASYYCQKTWFVSYRINN